MKFPGIWLDDHLLLITRSFLQGERCHAYLCLLCTHDQTSSVGVQTAKEVVVYLYTSDQVRGSSYKHKPCSHTANSIHTGSCLCWEHDCPAENSEKPQHHMETLPHSFVRWVMHRKWWQLWLYSKLWQLVNHRQEVLNFNI